MAHLQTSNEWGQKEFECFQDPTTTIFGLCCPLCLYCKTVNDLGEPCCMYCCLGFCFPTIGICMLRQKTRERYGIEGDTTMDFVCSCLCGSCVLCQTASEYKRRNGLL